MSKKLVKHGNSLALIIDKPLLQMLKINEKTNLELIIEDNSLIIRPTTKSRSKRSKKELKEIADEIFEKYADAFKKLAE